MLFKIHNKQNKKKYIDFFFWYFFKIYLLNLPNRIEYRTRSLEIFLHHFFFIFFTTTKIRHSKISHEKNILTLQLIYQQFFFSFEIISFSDVYTLFFLYAFYFYFWIFGFFLINYFFAYFSKKIFEIIF